MYFFPSFCTGLKFDFYFIFVYSSEETINLRVANRQTTTLGYLQELSNMQTNAW